MQHTLYVNSKEASGYGMLSHFSLLVCDVMCEKYPTVTFKIDPQFYVCIGKKYSSDQFLVMLSINGIKVLVVWEYKSRVATDIADQAGWHISTILQAFYLQNEHSYSYPVLHCLTDLHDFHYFLLTSGGFRALKLLKYVYLESDLTKEHDVLHHLCFLFNCINIE